METKYTILVVDDSPQNLQIIGKLMEESGYNTVLADSAQLMYEYLETELPSLILLDVVMPDTDGFEVIKALKSNEKYSAIPVIFITARSDTDDVVRGFELGAVDYVCKPVNLTELKARVKTHIQFRENSDRLKQLNNELSQANESLIATNRIINSKNAELKLVLSELDFASKTDYLTGLNNRRYMLEKISHEILRCRRIKRPFGIIIGDIDHFKQINDTYGHDCGDEVLKSVSNTLKGVIREVDSVARWGGEEFLLLVVEINSDDALYLGERLRYAIENNPIIYGEELIHITMTFGVSLFDAEKDSEHDIILRADNALYMGKNNGRNRVCLM